MAGIVAGIPSLGEPTQCRTRLGGCAERSCGHVDASSM
jgi:hypothetical protein